MVNSVLSRLFQSGFRRGVACCLPLLPLIVGCGNAVGDGLHASEQVASESQQLQATPQLQIAPNGDTTVIIESKGHKFQFAVHSSGPNGISESAPIGEPTILNNGLVATNTLAELYQLVAGPGATVPDALLNAQNPSNASTATSVGAGPVLAPDLRHGASGSGPVLFDSGEQSWFQSTFCQPGWECVQGWAWVDSSAGYAHGRGYNTYAMNGSEASCARTFNEDYWNGSTWANLVSESISPGTYNEEWAGNIGAPTTSDGDWYFESELNDCGGASTQVSLADFTYIPSSRSFTMSGSGEIMCNNAPCNATANVTQGNINVSFNGNWSTVDGDLQINQQTFGTDSYHTNVSCTVPGSSLTISWYCQPGQNLFQDPTCGLSNQSGTDSSVAANWGSVYAAWQSSSVITCDVTSTLE